MQVEWGFKIFKFRFYLTYRIKMHVSLKSFQLQIDPALL